MARGLSRNPARPLKMREPRFGQRTYVTGKSRPGPVLKHKEPKAPSVPIPSYDKEK